MAKFTKKPVEVEAITFDELVKLGKANSGNVVNGMPWSFEYKGHRITHENDECYLIPTMEGTMRFTADDMLITGIQGEIYPCKKDIFFAAYDPSDTKKSACSCAECSSGACNCKTEPPKDGFSAERGKTAMQRKISEVCDEIKNILLDKNESYGNSA